MPRLYCYRALLVPSLLGSRPTDGPRLPVVRSVCAVPRVGKKDIRTTRGKPRCGHNSETNKNATHSRMSCKRSSLLTAGKTARSTIHDLQRWGTKTPPTRGVRLKKWLCGGLWWARRGGEGRSTQQHHKSHKLEQKHTLGVRTREIHHSTVGDGAAPADDKCPRRNGTDALEEAPEHNQNPKGPQKQSTFDPPFSVTKVWTFGTPYVLTITA